MIREVVVGIRIMVGMKMVTHKTNLGDLRKFGRSSNHQDYVSMCLSKEQHSELTGETREIEGEDGQIEVIQVTKDWHEEVFPKSIIMTNHWLRRKAMKDE